MLILKFNYVKLILIRHFSDNRYFIFPTDRQSAYPLLLDAVVTSQYRKQDLKKTSACYTLSSRRTVSQCI
jgi:hypothetical protein